MIEINMVMLQDTDPELVEAFLVNITGVHLVGGNPELGSRPSVRNPGFSAVISIAENDGARGLVQFNVLRVSLRS